MGKDAFVKAVLETGHSAYYELVYGLINCVEYGVPQNRVRFICMGTRRDLWEYDGKLASLPAPTHFDRSDIDRMALPGFRGGDLPESAANSCGNGC